jgi:hypothetical protein
MQDSRFRNQLHFEVQAKSIDKMDSDNPNPDAIPSHQGPGDMSSRNQQQGQRGRSRNRTNHAKEERRHTIDDTSTEERRPIAASISLPIPPQPDSRSRYRVASGDGRSSRKTSEIAIPVQPSRDPSMSSSRRSYSRGAMFGDIPEYIGSPIARRSSVGTMCSGNFDANEDQGIGASSVECESEIEGLMSAQKSYVSRISAVHPVTGQTLYWGFTKKQWFLLFVFSVADLLAGVVYSLQAPFYPAEVRFLIVERLSLSLLFNVQIVNDRMWVFLGRKEGCHCVTVWTGFWHFRACYVHCISHLREICKFMIIHTQVEFWDS